MWRGFRPDPDEFQASVDLLCKKIQTIALRSGMLQVDCDDLERSLAVMEETVRDRVHLMLDGVAIHTEYTDHTMCFAARYLLGLAQSIWKENPHPVTHPDRVDSADRRK
jgi:hypothetical protein